MENKVKQGRTFYCAGPFWDPDCKKFFDEFKQRIKETTMTNESHADDQEPLVECGDQVFMPGHFEVNFPEIKKSFDVSSFKRVLSQILYLDTEAGINDKSMVVYVPGYDLGTMFEVGYFIAHSCNGSKIADYNRLRRNLILHKADEKMAEAIDKSLDYIMSFYQNYSENRCESASFGVIDNSLRIIGSKTNFSALAIRLDNSSETPFNSIMAGIAYRFSIPFITYSMNDTKSNTMMIGASIGHIKTNNRTLDRDVVGYFNNISKNVWTDDNINYAKDIK